MDAECEIQSLIDEAPGTGRFMCAICLHKFETREEKWRHMEDAHGYTTLELTLTATH